MKAVLLEKQQQKKHIFETGQKPKCSSIKSSQVTKEKKKSGFFTTPHLAFPRFQSMFIYTHMCVCICVSIHIVFRTSRSSTFLATGCFRKWKHKAQRFFFIFIFFTVTHQQEFKSFCIYYKSKYKHTLLVNISIYLLHRIHNSCIHGMELYALCLYVGGDTEYAQEQRVILVQRHISVMLKGCALSRKDLVVLSPCFRQRCCPHPCVFFVLDSPKSLLCLL